MPVKGPESESAVRGDLEWGTIPRLLEDSARRFAGREALVDGPLRLDFPGLLAEARRAAAAFVAAGLEPGDRGCIWAPNVAEWVVAALGLQSAGGVLVPLNTRFKGTEAAYVLEKSGARFLVTVNGFLGTDYVELLRGAAGGAGAGRPVEGLPALEHAVVLRGHAPPGTEPWDAFLAAGEGVPEAEVEARAAAVRPEDLSDILFTSGTTGMPKGVMCTHAQTLRAYRDWCEVVGLREGDRYLIINPFFHGFGYKAGWLACLMIGATVIPQAVFDVPDVMAKVPAERVTVLPGPPTLYQTMLAHPDLPKFDQSTLRLTVTGTTNVPVELVHRMRRELSFEHIVTGYGLTESCAIATMCRHDDDIDTIMNTAGRPIPGVEVMTVDDAGAEVPAGEPGEVLIRGYNVMRGYYDDPEETAATIDADGWLHTGDVGVLDDRGYLTITDRKKDMFIVGGFNAYPAEIENLLLGNDSVAQVAVVGMPDERMGEVGAAFVVLRPGATATEDELVAWSREHMANYKVPRRVVFVDELPLNASGKVLKFRLREALDG